MGTLRDEIQLKISVNGDQGEQKYKDLIKQSRTLRGELRNLSVGSTEFAAKSKELNQVNGVLRKIRSETNGVQKGFFLSNTAAGIFRATLASLGVTAGLAAIFRGFQRLIGGAADLQAAMSEVSAVSGATGADLDKLQAKAEALGRSTTKTATEAAQGLKFLALAGFSTAEQLTAIEPVLRLSEAGNIDLARASDLATDAMSALGIQADELEGFLDIVTNASTKSNTSIDQMAEAYIKTGGQLRGLGVPLTESAGLLGTLANRGIKGAEAGTKLNAVLIQLTTGSGEAGKAMDELGVSAFDQAGQFRGTSTILQDLNEKLKTMTPAQQQAYKAMIGGKRQVDTLNALLSGQSEEFAKLTGELENSEGKLNDVAKVMQDNFRGETKALGSAISGLANDIGLKLLPFLTKIVRGLTEFTLALSSVPQFIRDNRVAIGALIVAMITLNAQSLAAAANKLRLAAAARGATIATAAQTTAQRGLNAVMRANPLGLIITALAFLVSGFDIAYRKSETFRANIAGIQAVAVEFFAIIKESVQAFSQGFSDLADGNFKKAFVSFGDALTNANPITLAIRQGGRLAGAYTKGYKDKLKQEADEAEAEKLLAEAAALDFSAPAENITDPADAVTPGPSFIEPGDTKDKKETPAKKTPANYKDIYTQLYEQALENVKKNIDEIDKEGTRGLDELEIQFLNRLLTEQEYEDLALEQKLLNIQRKQDFLTEAHLTETEQFRKLEIEKLTIQKEADDKKLENAKRTAELRLELEARQVDGIKNTLQEAINFLGEDEAARKKHGAAIKAFEAAKISVNLPSEIQSIWKNANETYPFPLSAVIGGVQSALAVGRAASALNKVRKAKFYYGGYTGDRAIYNDGTDGVAGLVHVGEYVIPKNMVQDPTISPTISFLENVRQRRGGFAAGGLADVDTTPAGIAGAPLQRAQGGGEDALLETMRGVLDAVRNFPTQLKANVAYSELQAVGSEIADIENEAAI